MGWVKLADEDIRDKKSRNGGFHKIGFEGGQMPLQASLAERGFKSSLASLSAEINLNALSILPAGRVDILILKKAGLIGSSIKMLKLLIREKLKNRL